MIGPHGNLRIDRVLLVAILLATMLSVFVLPRALLDVVVPDVVTQRAQVTNEPNIYAAARAAQLTSRAEAEADGAHDDAAQWTTEEAVIGPHPAEHPAGTDAPADADDETSAAEG